MQLLIIDVCGTYSYQWTLKDYSIPSSSTDRSFQFKSPGQCLCETLSIWTLHVLGTVCNVSVPYIAHALHTIPKTVIPNYFNYYFLLGVKCVIPSLCEWHSCLLRRSTSGLSCVTWTSWGTFSCSPSAVEGNFPHWHVAEFEGPCSVSPVASWCVSTPSPFPSENSFHCIQHQHHGPEVTACFKTRRSRSDTTHTEYTPSHSSACNFGPYAGHVTRV